MARLIVSQFSILAIQLQRLRMYANTFLRCFGIHCATHQIRLILISAVVITSLSYPALAIYWSTPSYSRLVSTSNVLDPFLAEHVAFGSHAQRDLQHLWQGHPILQPREDEVARARCGFDRTLRVERILVRSNTAEEAGALTYQTLSSTLQLQRRILEHVHAQRISCLRASLVDCFVLSPLAFWNHDESRLRADFNISNTLKHYDDITVAGIFLTPQMVLAGRSYDWTGNIRTAHFLALTFVFLESDCSTNAGHSTWLQILANSTNESVDVFAEAVEPSLIALEYDHSLARSNGFSSISSFVYLAYGIFFAYVSWSMKRMKGVHTRIGLTFTALFEIAASTVTSLSVCALMRFKVNMVPWSLLPIVIIFVGAENMFNLVDAVTKTPVTLPVKERVAEGLSRAGTTNTLKVVSYNTILGVIAYFSAGAIRQFCTFAVVILVAHWFLAHTFFLAVLSIDIQRLELGELLRQNPNLTPVAGSHRNPTSTTPSPWWQQITHRTKELLKSRATKNISLLLLLAITGTLYVMTRPSTRDDPDVGVVLPPTAFPHFSPQTQHHDAHDPAWRIWKVLNPDEDPLVHLRIEVPTIVAFRPDIDVGQTFRHNVRRSTPVLGLMSWLMKILVLPMVVTLIPLYALLLYLLKDAELLEAERNRADGDSVATSTAEILGDHISFFTLPRAFATDIELLATSARGNVLAAVGLQNELSIWVLGENELPSNDTAPVLLRTPVAATAPLTISALAVNDSGNFVGFGTLTGAIHVGLINGKDVTFQQPMLGGSKSAVKEVHFLPVSSTPLKRNSGPRSRPSTPVSSGTQALIALYEDGAAALWKLEVLPTYSLIQPTSSGTAQAHFVRVPSSDDSLVAFSLQDGSLELIEISGTQEASSISSRLKAGNPFDRVAKVDACCAHLNDGDHVIVGVITEAGVVSLWDAKSSECLLIMDELHGNVEQLRISGIRSETCHLCGELPLDSFLVVLSLSHTVVLYRAYMISQTRRCSCLTSVLRQAVIMSTGSDRRSRSGSTVSTPGPLSSAKRSSNVSGLLPPDTSFPVSGHGILLRRTSEKEFHRRPTENLSLPSVIDEHDDGHAHPVGPLYAALLRPCLPSKMTVTRAGKVTCERGGWDIANGKVIGIRRISRSKRKGDVGASIRGGATIRPWGLTEAVLDRWECWTYEPTKSLLQASSLTTLHGGPSRSSLPVKSSESPITNIYHPRLPFTRVTSFQISGYTGMAGFGNTVGIFHFS